MGSPKGFSCDNQPKNTQPIFFGHHPKIAWVPLGDPTWAPNVGVRLGPARVVSSTLSKLIETICFKNRLGPFRLLRASAIASYGDLREASRMPPSPRGSFAGLLGTVQHPGHRVFSQQEFASPIACVVVAVWPALSHLLCDFLCRGQVPKQGEGEGGTSFR